jgi:radical SAM superfamily enzyme YgiQ (UPF0313 family)
LYYPFWLAYTAGVLDKEGFEVTFLDAPAQKISELEILKKSKEIKPKLVVIDTSTPSIHSDILMGSKIKLSLGDCFIVLVGTHPSALPDWVLSKSRHIDAVAVGEYDYTIRDLAVVLRDSGSLRSIKGLVYRDREKIIDNGRRDLIEDLDALPFVSKTYVKYLDIKNYFFAAADYPMMMIITGRGCPFSCFFCVYPQVFHSRRYRLRSAKNVVDELEYITKELPCIKEVGIEDDTFTVDVKRVKEICNLIIERRIKIKWYCNARVGLDLLTMRLMKEAGCRLMAAGFESGDQKVLDSIHKGTSIDKINEFVTNAKKAKILVHACFMAGNPGDTKKTLNDTLRLAKKLNCDSAQFYPLLVYPGTEAYAWSKKNQYLSTENYCEWNNEKGGYNCVINLPGLSSDEILEYCNRSTREYYLRPRYIGMKLIRMLTNPNEIKRTVLAAKTFFSYLKQ